MENTTIKVPKKLYLQVAEALEMEIRAGKFVPGMELPTSVALVERFYLTRSTIERAIFTLAEKGLVEFRNGKTIVMGMTEGRGSDYDPTLSAEKMLANCLREAFGERDANVTLDVVNLTGEMLYNVLVPILNGVRSSESDHPSSITVRLLFSDFDTQLVLPSSVENPLDERPQNRLRGLMRRFIIPLEKQLKALQMGGLVQRVDVKIRTIPLMSMTKLYMINGREALSGDYLILKKQVSYHDDEFDILDVVIRGGQIFHYLADVGDERSTNFVHQKRMWFESLWLMVAKELSLSDLN
jgi:DNA-binding transcriptional regulator YhcF (GntR family)